MKTGILQAELICSDNPESRFRIKTVYGQVCEHSYSIDEQLCLVENVTGMLRTAGIVPGNPLWDVFLPGSPGEQAGKGMTAWSGLEMSENIAATGNLVSITLDNSRKAIAYPGEDPVTISRKYTPKLKYEYFVNGIQCRPKDIVEILDAAGIRQGNAVFNALLGGIDALSPLGLGAPAAAEFINKLLFAR